ncbi:PREDICTED: proline-rich protein 23B [Chrysochloris asiatica]|uniref:Proline-rich protein 23B n=1 Tax=Chrysochloris asiatica TaxID=185453 RepID=A0A9B0WLD4_CHRAS|nr:PREDICTED: proline-rich protein 23B [Chrysochloris asiatica]
MNRRPRSPSPSPASWWGLQPGEPRPAKLLRWEGPEIQAGPPPAADSLASVVVLASDCALQVPLRDADLVLEPAPESVLRVSLGDHTLILVHEALLGSGVEDDGLQSDLSVNLDLDSFLSAPWNEVSVEQGSYCESVSETTAQAETYEEDADHEFLQLQICTQTDTDAELSCSTERVLSPCPQDLIPGRSPWVSILNSQHLRPFPSSPLEPLPPSPSPDAHERPQRSPRPPCRARRRLF